MDAQNETSPLPEGYALPRPRRIPATPAELETPDPRFAQFSELCAAFSRMLLQDRGMREDLSPDRAVERNLTIARTVFAKWGFEIMLVLYGQPEGLGFERIRRSLEGISPRVLSQKLKTLETQKLLSREVLAERPPRVSYALTPRGRDLARMSEPIFLFLDAILADPRADPASPRVSPKEAAPSLEPTAP